MKTIFSTSGSRNSIYTWIATGFLAVLLFAASATLATPEETPASVPANSDLTFPLGKFLPDVEPASMVCVEICNCESFVTPPTTRVGATCLRARQNAAAAARAIAVCPFGSNSCRSTTHSVAPCQALSTGGFSATAVATYYCTVCEEDCIDVP